MEVMSRTDRWVYRFFVLVWLALNFFFWIWWFQGEHISSWPLFVLMTVPLFYETSFLPSAYLFYVGRMKKPIIKRPAGGLRVAMITLCVPSKESFEVIERQLGAMVAVAYPHDSWILDEENDTKVRILASKYGVKHFTRRGKGEYNQPCPPFQAKTKAGNVNAWIDSFGRDYEIFTQLDIDHNPRVDYLDKVLGFFVNPRVGWVQAPSIYKNLEHWTARGSAEQELVLQGPLQMGFYGWSSTPFIIGSHSTYRMSAIREIGGFQPTRAEDHLDTIVLARHRYKGVFIPEPIAVGDGPETFDIYLAQQFAWAYSMIQVLFKYLPKYVSGYDRRQAFQFLFAQTWYTCWSTSMAILFLLPCVAVLSCQTITQMPFVPFVLRYFPVLGMTLVIWFWTKKWFQPKGLMLSWRGAILHIARWPVVLMALFEVILGVKKPYMITAKGKNFGECRTLSLGSQLPYLVLLIFSFLTVWTFILKGESNHAQGYLLFVLEGILFFLAVYVAVLFNDLRSLSSEGIKPRRVLHLRAQHLFILVVLTLSLFGTSIVVSPPIIQAVSWSPEFEATVRIADLPLKTEQELAVEVPIIPTVVPIVPLPTSRVAIGAYDPDGILDGLALDYQHSYVVWFKVEDFSSAIEKSKISGRFPLISLEPWPLIVDGLSGENLLRDINAGRYDVYIDQLAKAAKDQAPQTILVRWGHEMELTGLYPWSQGNTEAYKAGYRRIVDAFKRQGVDNVRWVWSPAGNLGAEDYFPGDTYVDYVGVTVLADERWEKEAGFDHVRSFEELVSGKYRLSVRFNKPLIVAEAGNSSSGDYDKQQWLIKAKESFSSFPKLAAFVYFEAENAQTIDGYRPIWTVDGDIIKEVFLKRE